MKKILLIIMALVITLLPLTACKPTDDSVIRVNEVTHSIFYAPQYLASELGYFKDAGLTVELTNGGGADKTMAAVLSNNADIGLCGPEAVIYVNIAGGMDNYPMVFGQLTKRDGSFLVGRTSQPNFDYSGLDGKTVIMGRKGGVPAMTLQYLLNNKGYTNGKNMTMDYSVPFNVMGPTFAAGTGDYVTLFEPAASELVKLGKGYIVSSIGETSGEIPYTAYMANKDYIKKNGDKLEKFLECINKATLYLLSNDNATIAKKLAPYFVGVDESIIAESVKNYRANDTWVLSPSMEQKSFDKLQEIMMNAGELSKKVSFSDIVDNTIANKIGK